MRNPPTGWNLGQKAPFVVFLGQAMEILVHITQQGSFILSWQPIGASYWTAAQIKNKKQKTAAHFSLHTKSFFSV